MLPNLTLPESPAPPLTAAPSPARSTGAPAPARRPPRKLAAPRGRESRGRAKRDRDPARKAGHTPPAGGRAVDLLAVTPERIRRALWRSFLRYGITGELDAAVHAAMSVIGPVLEARDSEIMRLRETPG